MSVYSGVIASPTAAINWINMFASGEPLVGIDSGHFFLRTNVAARVAVGVADPGTSAIAGIATVAGEAIEIMLDALGAELTIWVQSPADQSDVYIDIENSGSSPALMGIAGAAGYVDVGDVATYAVLAKDSGRVHSIPGLTADLVLTLPAVAKGLNYKFVYAGIVPDAEDWQFTTGADANFYLGGLVHVDIGAGSSGDEIVPIAGDGNSNSRVNILVPTVGTEVSMVCDGLNWILSGTVVGETLPTFADQ